MLLCTVLRACNAVSVTVAVAAAVAVTVTVVVVVNVMKQRGTECAYVTQVLT